MRIIWILICLALGPLSAQSLDKKQMEARLEASKKAEEGSAEAGAAPLWEEALASLDAAAAARKVEAEVRAELKTLEKPEILKVPDLLPPGASLKELEALEKSLEDQIKENEARLKTLSDQAKQSPAEAVALAAEKTKLEMELARLEIPPSGSTEVEAARHQQAVQTKARLEARLAEIAAKQALNQRRAVLYEERILAAKTHEAELEETLGTVEEKIAALKTQEAEDARQAIAQMEERFEKIPALAQLVSEIKDIRAEQDEIEKKLAEAKSYTERVDQIGKEVEREYERAEGRISLLERADLGVDDETGMLLRKQRASLPSVDEIAAELRTKLEEVAQVEIALLNVNDRLKNLPLIGEEKFRELTRPYPELQPDQVKELVEGRRAALGNLAAAYRRLQEEMTKGTSVAQESIRKIEKYSNFIDERLLWIKSAKPLHWRELMQEWGRVVNLLGPTSLISVAETLLGQVRENLGQVILVALIVAVIWGRRGKLAEVLKTRSEQAARRNCTSIRPTLEYLGAAILLSGWFPLLVWLGSDLLQGDPAWNEGLHRLSVTLFLIHLLLIFSRAQGLFVSHFRMIPERAARVHRNLQWLVPVAPAFVFLVPALTGLETEPASGRVVFMLAMMVLVFFLHHLFVPSRSILQKGETNTGFTKTCYLLIMACPVVFILGAALGYLESVLTLRDQVGATGVLFLLAFLVVRFLTRWTLVSRRSLAIQQALRRREAAAAEREQDEEGRDRAADLPSLEEVKAEAVDVVEVEEQTKKLFKVAVFSTVIFGLWAIWSSTLTPLSVLDKVELWKDGSAPAASASPVTSMIPGTGPESDGKEGTAGDPVSELVPRDDGRVTLQDLLLTVVFLVLTFVAATNIPGVLSLVLFNRIKLGPGGNFALTTTFRYLIVLVGIVFALGQIGITWGKVQWLAAAVSLGIGFGLQEIIANFVAGIILLFERPIRLGDIVTVGDISGTVTQIKIRATTIKQFNNRELLVPNKEFITSQLVNWTLNDPTLRLEIPVGIAYGSDTTKAKEVLEKILREHPNVIDDPGPSVFFMGFGNSTLDFEARAFVSSVDFLLGTKSELHYQIDDAFREAGIEIAFPQQDVHVRSLPAEMKLTQS